MNSPLIRASFAYVTFLITSIAAQAQLTESQVRTKAEDILESVGEQRSEISQFTTSELPSYAQGPSRRRVHILHSNFMTMSFSDDLLNKSFSDPRMDDSHFRHDFSTDEKVWREAERIAHAWNGNPAMRRTEIKAGPNGTEACKLQVNSLFGYDADGDYLRMSFLRAKGKIVDIWMTSGWTAEPPNIQTEPSEAIAKAIAIDGGSANDWNYRLVYDKIVKSETAPEASALGERRIMRLTYHVFGPRGSVQVDSVTGKVVWHGHAASEAPGGLQSGSAPSGNQNDGAISQPLKSDTTFLTHQQNKLLLGLAAITVLTTPLAILILVRRRR